ncbi:hypothetical protein HMPREF9418_2525 [Neisseria macacae ATCC 33926]|uniref:Uncharacterized protein n=1 Tax=Neisseria macacae ATCC 33926 TaxID=997348 RepID=A0AA36UI96_9NEIS|nr:hypothetical protein HMPREF9418_2525 [Neisseria macacae ATCC 33926]
MFAYLGLTFIHHKTQIRSSETRNHMVSDDLLSFPSAFQTTLQQEYRRQP